MTLVDYVYAATGQRAIKTTPTATTHYLYDPGGALYAETDGAGNVLREYITLGGATLAIVDALGVSFVHDDHLGTPQVMTDGSAAVVWDASYRPFGEASIAGAAANEQRFPGQTADAETGYSDNWHRTYDPSLGRYLQSDPIGIMAGFNTYGYAGGNPVMNIDPTGQILPFLIYWMIGTEFAVGYAEGFIIAYSAYQAVLRIYARYEGGCRGWDLVSVWDVLDLVSVLRFVRVVKIIAGVGKTSPSFHMTGDGGTPPVPTKGSGPGFPGGGGGPKGPGGGGGGPNMSSGPDTTRVGRWMSSEEFAKMEQTGKVQESYSGTTHVATPADPEAFISQAPVGSKYVEFDVPVDSVTKTGENWGKIIGPNSLEGRLAQRKNMPIPQMPDAQNIQHLATKFRY